MGIDPATTLVCATDAEIEVLRRALQQRIDKISTFESEAKSINKHTDGVADILESFEVYESSGEINKFASFSPKDDGDICRERECLAMGLEDASGFNQQFTSILDHALPAKLQTLVQDASPPTILAIVENSKFVGYTDGEYLPEVARCCDLGYMKPSKKELRTLRSLAQRYQLFDKYGPALPEIIAKTIAIFSFRFRIHLSLTFKSKAGDICVIPHADLLFYEHQCKQFNLDCPERKLIEERVAIANKSLTPILNKDNTTLPTLAQYRKTIRQAQGCGVSHPIIEIMSMNVEQFYPWVASFKELEQILSKKNVAIPYEKVVSLHMKGQDLSFCKESEKMKTKIDQWYEEAHALELQGQEYVIFSIFSCFVINFECCLKGFLRRIEQGRLHPSKLPSFWVSQQSMIYPATSA